MKSNEFKYPKAIEFISILNSLDNSLIKLNTFLMDSNYIEYLNFLKIPCKKTDLTSTFFPFK